MQRIDPGLTLRERRDFFLQLQLLFEAGVPIVSALNCIGTSGLPKFKLLAGDISVMVQQGQYLSHAMGRFPNSFDRFSIAMLKLGEKSGRLGLVLARLATRVEWQLSVRRRLGEALTYPAVVIAISLSLVGLMSRYMLPRILPLLTSLEVPIPWPTQMLISVVNNQWIPLTLGALFLIVVADLVWGQQEREARARQWLLYSTPLIGTINRNRAFAHLCHDLSLVFETGLSFVESLRVLGEESSDRRLGRAVESVRKGLREGEEVQEALERQPYIPELVTSAIVSGLETGEMPKLLSSMGRVLDSEAEVATDRLISMLEPLTIFFLGVIVGGILLACFLPLYSMMSQGL